MKRRSLSLLLALTLCFGLLPTTARAEEHSPHPLCTHTSACACPSEGKATAFADAQELTLKSGKLYAGTTQLEGDASYGYYLPAGSYYLGGDIETSTQLYAQGNVNLCLNGHSIRRNASGAILILEGGAALTLTDCKGSGVIRHVENPYIPGERPSGYGVLVEDGSFTMYGGTITWNKHHGVSIGSGTTFAMYGGEISDNSNGGVEINGGTFTMQDGTIRANSGSGVYVGGGTFTMRGGTIGGSADGDANTAERGGGVFAGGIFMMRGGKICGNSATQSGGGVYADDRFWVSGNVSVANNKVSDEPNNVYLPGGTTLHVGGALTSGAKSIGVTLESLPAEAGKFVTIADGSAYQMTDDDASAFFPDNDYDNAVYSVKRSENYLHLVRGQAHQHKICIGTDCADESHNDVTFVALTYDKTSKTLSFGGNRSQVSDGYYQLHGGKWYLTDNIELDAPILITGDVQLCLNGYSIILNKDNSEVVCLKQSIGGSLTLGDCRKGNAANAYGKLTHGAKDDGTKYTGRGVQISGSSMRATIYGGSIAENETETEGAGVRVGDNAVFTMYGGAVTGNKVTADGSTGGGIWSEGRTTIKGNAEISGNTAVGGETSGGRGAGIYSVNQLTIGGNAKIIDNRAENEGGTGGGVYTDNHLEINGQDVEIKRNTASSVGGGIYANYGVSFSVSGKVNITENQDGYYETQGGSNVFLNNDPEGNIIPITVSGELTDASIGVTLGQSALPQNGRSVTFAEAADASWIKQDSFTSDDKRYIAEQSVNQMVLKEHTHQWKFIAARDMQSVGLNFEGTIEAKCSVCDASGGSATVTTVDRNYYDGNSKPATLSCDFAAGIDAPEIYYATYSMYTGIGPSIGTTAPSAVGEYCACIAMGEVRVAALFVIFKGNLSASDFEFRAPDNAVYDGNGWSADVDPREGLSGYGDISVKYYDSKGNAVSAPINAGTYTVKIDVAEGDNYKVKGNLTGESWRFSIQPSGYALIIPGAQDVIAGSGLDAITVANGVTGEGILLQNGFERVPGTVAWYSDRGCMLGAVDADLSRAAVGDQVMLWWRFTPDRNAAPNYSGIKTGSTVFTIINGAAQDVRFESDGQTVTAVQKTYGDDARFTLAAVNKTEGGGEISYTSSDSSVATVETDGTVLIHKAGKTTIRATAAMVPGKYAASSASYELSVGKKSVTVSRIQAQDKTYDGTSAAQLDDQNMIIDGVHGNDDLTASCSNARFADANADENKTVTFTVTLRGSDADNYTLSEQSQTTATATIRQRPLRITDIARADKVYDGSASYSVTGETFEGFANGERLIRGEDYIISAAFPDADVDDANEDVTVSVTLRDTATARNYAMDSESYVIRGAAKITPAPHGAEATAGSAKYGNSGVVELGEKVVPGGTVIIDTVTDQNTVLDGGFSIAENKLRFAIVDDAAKVGATAEIRLKVTSRNFADYFINVTLTVEKKTDRVFTAPTAKPGLVYNGEEHVLINAGTTDGAAMQYKLNDGAYGAELPGAKNAGTYTVWYKIDGDEEYADVVDSITVTIGRRTVTVGPEDMTITQSDGIPTFKLAYAGLADGETLTPVTAPRFTIYQQDSDVEVNAPFAAGSYRIIWLDANTMTFTGAENYDVMRNTAGALKVNANSSSGYGDRTMTYPISVPEKTQSGAVSASAKSASKGSTVTITVMPGEGYVSESVRVLDQDGKELPLTDQGAGKYRFTMPASKVTVKASFAANSAAPDLFEDVLEDSYYYDAVHWAAERGITGGIGVRRFAPDAACTRAQMVTFLWRAAGSPEPEDRAHFEDVPADAYYAKAVAWAASEGIARGVDETRFDPNGTCTRADGVTFLARAAKASESDGKTGFADVPEDAYYASAVKWASENGIVKGIGGGLFGPHNDCTRAQIVTFLHRMQH